MTSRPLTPLFLVLLLAVAGCAKAPEPVAPVPAPWEPARAQPKLPTLKLWVGPEELIAELALTPGQQQTGMMFRTSMAENEAMLFVRTDDHQASYWMKNCPLPLSIAYISAEGGILEIHDLHPHNTNAVTSRSDNVRFALETSQGWFGRHNIRPGMIVRTERGSLLEAFQEAR